MPPAIVIGLCTHGLAICRSLSTLNIDVHAVDANLSLPGAKTKKAKVHQIASINDENLISNLITFHQSQGFTDKPVLFTTNDRMVEVLASGWQKLAPLYTLSWSKHVNLVAKLQRKDELERVCEQTGLNHPKSVIIPTGVSPQNATSSLKELGFPLIIKPVKPMSSFKVKFINNEDETIQLIKEHSDALPFIAQQWIEGNDQSLVFCSGYFEHGKAINHFTGHKLLSHPPTLGQGLVMAPYNNPEVKRQTEKFFEGTEYTGPASVEFKVAPDGKFWLIEPNIGRTEYSVACAISNGVELIHSEYFSAIGQPVVSQHQKNSHVWFDSEKSPGCYFRMAKKSKSLKIGNKKPVFTFFDLSDLPPFWESTKQKIVNKLKR